MTSVLDRTHADAPAPTPTPTPTPTPPVARTAASARGPAALAALHLPASLRGDGPAALSPRLWVWAAAPDARAPPPSAAAVRAPPDQPVLRRAAAETRLYSVDANLWAVPDHLAALGGASTLSDNPSISSFCSKGPSLSAFGSVSNLPRSMKQRKPVENPPPLPPRKDTRPIVTREVTYVQPSIPRLFVQLIDLRLKTSTQAFNVYCTIQVGNQVYFSSPLPLSQESRKGFGLVICPREGFLFDIPSIDPPSPYPILIQIHKGPPPPNNAISNIQTMSQKPITYSSSSNLSYSSTKAASKHRRKKSNDSVAHSIASISSTFSNFKTGLMRGIRGNTNNANVDGSGNGGGGGGGAGNRRMTLNISSPFRSKHPQTTTKAMASSIATSSATLLPPSDNILPAAAEATAAVSAASSKHQTASTAAPPFEPTYDIPCYYGSTICKSESHSNLFHYGNDDVPDVVIPETLLGQVVLVPQLNGDAKATFEKVVYNMEPEGAFGLSSLKLGGTKKSEKEVAIVSVQVGMFLDETYPLIVEIPPVEYSTFLNFQMSNRGGGIWKKYWVMIKKGIMHVYDFEYKENKPMISWVPLQGHLARISRPDPEEMCALNCLQLDFMTPFADQEVSLQPHEQRWRDAVVEASGIAYVTAETKDAMVELENILREFI